MECQFEALRSCTNKRELDQVLLSLLATLAETYSNALAAISESRSTVVRRLLPWLCCETFTLKELVGVLATDIGYDGAKFDEDSSVIDSEELLQFCPALKTSSIGSKYYFQYDCIARLTHFSVKEYLESFTNIFLNAVPFSLKPEAVKVDRMETCLNYILSPPVPCRREITEWEYYQLYPLGTNAGYMVKEVARHSQCILPISQWRRTRIEQLYARYLTEYSTNDPRTSES